jgi:type IV secretory pathway TrbD component
MAEDVDLIAHEMNGSLTRKILFMGVEKYYLKFMALPFLFAGAVIGPNINLTIFLIMVLNFAMFLLMGQFLARKNPFWVEIAMRHLSYKRFYLPHGYYNKHNEPFYSKSTKGCRVFTDVSRNN